MIISDLTKLKRYLWPFFLLVLVFFIFYAQAIRINFLLLDDGQLVLQKRQILQAITTGHITLLSGFILEPEVGRVRPVYWLIQTFFVWLSGESALWMHLWRLVQLATTLLLMLRIFSCFKTPKSLSYLLLILFLTNLQNLEDFYRLGPTEPYLVLLLLVTINLIIKPVFKMTVNKAVILTAFIIGCGIKETFLVNCLPLAILTFNPSKGQKKFPVLLLVTGLVIAGIIFGIKASYPHLLGSYADNYVIKFTSILSILNSYVLQLLKYQKQNIYMMVIAVLLVGVFSSLKRQVLQEKYLLLGLGIGLLVNLAILLPWQYAMGRYLLVFNCLTLLFIGFIFSRFSRLSVPYSHFSRVITASVTLAFVLLSFPINIVEISNFQNQLLFESAFTTDIVTGLNKLLPQGAIVLNNYVPGNDNIEIYMETLWHLQLFHNRYDIKYAYLKDSSRCAMQTQYIFDRTSTRLLPRSDLVSSLILVSSNSAQLTQIVPEKLFLDFVKKRSVYDWEVQFPFDWSLFKQSPVICI